MASRLSRRTALYLAVAGAFVVALVGWFLLTRSAPIPLVVHPISYSNVAVFEAATENPGRMELRRVPNPAQHAEILAVEGTKRPVVTVTPFANALIAMRAHPSFRIIGGAGLNGLSLVSREARNLSDLAGKRIGTSRGDSLEVFANEAMAGKPYQPVYFDDPFVAIEALKRGQIDALTHVEPFATQMVKDGMIRLTTSRELWGDHPDAVLVSTTESLQRFRGELRELIAMLVAAERNVRENPTAVAGRVAAFYAPLTVQDLVEIIPMQQPRIDLRGFEPFLAERYKTLQRLGYVPTGDFPADRLDFSLLPGK